MLQLLADMIFALKMPKHPNLFRPIGVKMNHSRVVMEHIESLDLGQYFRIYPAADRIGPVSPLCLPRLTNNNNVILFRAVGCS